MASYISLIFISIFIYDENDVYDANTANTSMEVHKNNIIIYYRCMVAHILNEEVILTFIVQRTLGRSGPHEALCS
jgi:hypothetical protein